MSANRPLAIALRAALLFLAAPAVGSSAARADLIWGVNGHPISSYPGISIETQLDHVRDLGLTSYRVDVSGTNNLPGLQRLVREASARGITVLPVVTPDLDLDKETPASIEKKAYGLARALVASFKKGEVPVWELGNELENYAIIKPCEMRDDGKQYDCANGPAGGVSVLDYFGPRWAKVSAVLKGLTEGAHAADPSVRRAVGTAGWGHIGAFARMKADGIDWDISVWHMYGQDPEWAFKELVRYERPIWVTEFNNPLGSQKGEQEQVNGLKHAISLLRGLQDSYKVEAAHIYELMDESYWGDTAEAHMGLVSMKKDGLGQWIAAEPKPAYAAVRELIGGSSAVAAAVERECTMRPYADAEALQPQQIVGYAYCLVLGRDPDGGGLAAWSARLAGGMSAEEFLDAMLGAYEFSQSHKVDTLSATQYATLLHRVLFGTDPSASALAHMVGELAPDNGDARGKLRRELIASKEFKSQHPTLFKKLETPVETGLREAPQARRSCDVGVMKRPLEYQRAQIIYGYCLVLGRWPDWNGLHSWTITMMRDGQTIEGILLSLLQSREFSQKYALDGVGNAGFTTFVYRLLLNRNPDGASLNAYVSQLDAGTLSRAQLYEKVVASDEFHKTQEALFAAKMPVRAAVQEPP
jgi:Domain of unknown function (DUF4214)